MGIKRYIFLSIVVIILLGLYVFTFQTEDYMIEFFGIPVTLPIAVWVVIPMGVIVLFSVLHMMYYGVKAFFINRALVKDQDRFMECAKSLLLKQDCDISYKTEWFKLPTQMLTAVIDAKKGFDILENEQLKKVCEDVNAIENEGEYVDIKSYRLPKDNQITIKNQYNRLKKEPKTAYDIVKSCSDLQTPLCIDAFDVLVSNASYTEIKKSNLPLNATQILTIMKRKNDENDDLFLDDNQVQELVNSIQMSEDEYLNIAKELKESLNPDILVNIFEKIYRENPVAGKAYLYVLFELQMMDEARTMLKQSDESEYEYFRIYLFLRDNNKNVDIDMFLHGND